MERFLRVAAIETINFLWPSAFDADRCGNHVLEFLDASCIICLQPLRLYLIQRLLRVV